MTGPAHCIIEIKAAPNAARTEIAGWLGTALKIKLKAPPVEGRANVALCAFLSERLNLPKGAVRVLTGETSRLKRVHISGLTLEVAKLRLGV